ncbi:MAG: virulence factor [Acidimicrobiia bacterium]
MAAQLVVIWWRDIPTQVNVQVGRTRYRAALPRRFQRAVDEAATVAGLTQASDYVAEWKREAQPLTADPDPERAQAAADDAAARFDAGYTKARLTAIAARAGIDPDRAAP